MKIKKSSLKYLILLIILIALGLFLISKLNPSPDIEKLALCLEKKGVTMYGAAWCPHCQKQKALFGEHFQHINYIECPQNPQLCQQNGITGYPTWDFGERKQPGELTLEQLSLFSGCS